MRRWASVVAPLTLGFSVMAALMGLLLLTSLYLYTQQLHTIWENILQTSLPQKLAAVRLRSHLLEMRWATDRYLHSGDPAERERAEEARTLAEEERQDLARSGPDDTQRDLSADYQAYSALIDTLVYHPLTDGVDLQATEGQVDDALESLFESTRAMDEQVSDQLEEGLRYYDDFFRRGYRIVSVVGGLLIFVGAATGLTLGRVFITRPLAQLTQAARRVGEGDLTAVRTIPTSNENEIGILAASFRHMADSLGQAIDRMHETAGTLITSADQLSSSASDLGELAEVTLAQMEEIAAGAETQREEIHATVQVATSIASALGQSALQAGEVRQAVRHAQESLDVASRTVTALDEDAEEIQNITGVIEQFAGETHMLALNAAIEARRAGEAGRGFVAVSDEMRGLAERSARSAGEVARFSARVQAEIAGIGQAVSQVQQAVTQTQTFAGETIDVAERQGEDANALADVVRRAAAVSDNQTRIAAQVSAAVADQATGIADLANAAQELSKMARQLEDLAARFVT